MKQKIGTLTLVIGLVLTSAAATIQASRGTKDRMLEAAQDFLLRLNAEQQTKATQPLDSEDRFDWHYIPRRRPGISIQELNHEQRRAAHDLLRSVLSSSGYLKATSIMYLEDVLRELERRAGRRASSRDPELYYFVVFGEPSASSPWGWRVEGHHLSLTFTSGAGDLVATTPAFMGANPAEVHDGPKAGFRILGAEEDLGRALLDSLDDKQRSRAIISTSAPRDIIMSPGRDEWPGESNGLALAAMSHAQRQLLVQLIEQYVNNVKDDVAQSALSTIKHADANSILFAWAGGTEPGEPYYYRIHGPSFVIEYDNGQSGANHVHSVWRDLHNDFGRDLLREHYQSRHSPDQ